MLETAERLAHKMTSHNASLNWAKIVLLAIVFLPGFSYASPADSPHPSSKTFSFEQQVTLRNQMFRLRFPNSPDYQETPQIDANQPKPQTEAAVASENKPASFRKDQDTPVAALQKEIHAILNDHNKDQKNTLAEHLAERADTILQLLRRYSILPIIAKVLAEIKDGNYNACRDECAMESALDASVASLEELLSNSTSPAAQSDQTISSERTAPPPSVQTGSVQAFINPLAICNPAKTEGENPHLTASTTISRSVTSSETQQSPSSAATSTPPMHPTPPLPNRGTITTVPPTTTQTSSLNVQTVPVTTLARLPMTSHSPQTVCKQQAPVSATTPTPVTSKPIHMTGHYLTASSTEAPSLKNPNEDSTISWVQAVALHTLKMLIITVLCLIACGFAHALPGNLLQGAYVFRVQLERYVQLVYTI
ncbi:MAG: hypothetical protein AAB323_02140 [Pseudomonadota bacterium]